MLTRRKTHIERWPEPVLLFGFMPAFCGRKKPGDYRMMPPDDSFRRRCRGFFVNDGKEQTATCKVCKQGWSAWRKKHAHLFKKNRR